MVSRLSPTIWDSLLTTIKQSTLIRDCQPSSLPATRFVRKDLRKNIFFIFSIIILYYTLKQKSNFHYYILSYSLFSIATSCSGVSFLA